MEITAQLVKELREKTNAGLMDCKNALKEVSGDIDNAIKYLKEKGMIKAAGKSGRETKEGMVCLALAEDQSQAIAVEITCETDFVARTDDFKNAAQNIAHDILKTNANEASELSEDIQNKVKTLIAQLGENMSINRVARMKNTTHGHITQYIHQDGKIGVLVHCETNEDKTHNEPLFETITKDVAMHIAAMNPAGLSKDDLDPKVLKEQEGIFTTQAKESGKPDNIIEKMITGKMNQFVKEIALLEQAFVKEPKLSVQKYIDTESKKLNDQIKVKQFIRIKIGE